MRNPTGKEIEELNCYLNITKEIANQATCLRSKCGSIIIKDKKIIGSGFNSPPADNENQRRCECNKSHYNKKITDKTCCATYHSDIINLRNKKIGAKKIEFQIKKIILSYLL